MRRWRGSGLDARRRRRELGFLFLPVQDVNKLDSRTDRATYSHQAILWHEPRRFALVPLRCYATHVHKAKRRGFVRAASFEYGFQTDHSVVMTDPFHFGPGHTLGLCGRDCECPFRASEFTVCPQNSSLPNTGVRAFQLFLHIVRVILKVLDHYALQLGGVCTRS